MHQTEQNETSQNLVQCLPNGDVHKVSIAATFCYMAVGLPFLFKSSVVYIHTLLYWFVPRKSTRLSHCCCSYLRRYRKCVSPLFRFRMVHYTMKNLTFLTLFERLGQDINFQGTPSSKNCTKPCVYQLKHTK